MSPLREGQTLDPAEFLHAATVGTMRRVLHVLKQKGDRFCAPDDYWGADIEAACAEMLVARESDRYWIGVINGKDSGGDAGPYGVRHTLRANGSLILHPSDSDDRRFVLVVGTAPFQRIAGSILGEDGKLEKFWRDDVKHPAFFVPQSALDSLTSIPLTARRTL